MTNANEPLQQQLELERQRSLELQKQLKILQQQADEFTYIISHDLQAPIRSVASLSEWLQQDYGDSLDSDGQHLMALLTQQAKQLGLMVEAIRDFSRIGRICEENDTIDLLLLIRSIVSTVSQNNESKFLISPSLPSISGEPHRIKQLFTRLIENAAQHNRPENGAVEINAQDIGDYWEITITDHGLGIAPKYHDTVFKIFRQLSTNNSDEALGIGLTFAKKIVETHGGSISIRSEVNYGTTIVVVWPKGDKISGHSNPNYENHETLAE